MEEVVIVTRDISGNRTSHFLRWDKVYEYIEDQELKKSADEILMITVDGTCVYSGLYSAVLEWEDVLAFFG